MTRRLLRSRLSNRDDPERGAALVVFALALVCICLFVSFGIDVGNFSQTNRAAANATESAAVSGAGLLKLGTTAEPETSIVTQVENYIISNEPTYPGLTAGSSLWDQCTSSLPLGWSQPPDSSGNTQNCIAFNAASNANIIQVAIPPEVVTFWFGAGNVTGQKVNSVSYAEFPPAGEHLRARCASSGQVPT